MPFYSVGDTDQLLYRFQGSKPELITDEIDEYLPNIQTVKLAINYRSRDEIIAKSQQLIGHNYSDLEGPYPQEFMKDVKGIRGQGDSIKFTMYPNADLEAIGVAATIQELLQGDYKFGDFFVGTRTRAQLGYVEGVLVRAGVKFINIAGGSFWASKHVSDVIAYLRLAHNTSDDKALERVYNIPSANHVYAWNDKNGRFKAGDYCPTRYLGREFLAKIQNGFDNIDRLLFSSDGWRYKTRDNQYNEFGPTKAQDLQEFVWKLQELLLQVEDVGQVIRVIIEDCYERYLRYEGAGDDGLANAKLEDLATVEELAGKYTSVDEFLTFVDDNIKAAEDAKNKDWGDYVVLSTIHRLKGLERKIVFGLGWSEGVDLNTDEPRGLLPHSFSLAPPPSFGVLPSGGMSPVEDERCIGFVLVTRAKERCYLSGIETYRTWQMWPSRFIKEMELIKDETEL